MANYYIRKQSLGTNHRSIIRDENRQPLYLMVGKWGNKNDALSIYDLNGHLLAQIRQTSLSIFPQFEIYVDGERIAKFRKRFHFQTTFFFISKLNWLVKGDFAEHHYTIQHGKTEIMDMDIAYFPNGSFYSLDIPEKENVLTCLCISAVIDHWLIKHRPAGAKLNKLFAKNRQPIRQNFWSHRK